jgi:hypothetical protein
MYCFYDKIKVFVSNSLSFYRATANTKLFEKKRMRQWPKIKQKPWLVHFWHYLRSKWTLVSILLSETAGNRKNCKSYLEKLPGNCNFLISNLTWKNCAWTNNTKQKNNFIMAFNNHIYGCFDWDDHFLCILCLYTIFQWKIFWKYISKLARTLLRIENNISFFQ